MRIGLAHFGYLPVPQQTTKVASCYYSVVFLLFRHTFARKGQSSQRWGWKYKHCIYIHYYGRWVCSEKQAINFALSYIFRQRDTYDSKQEVTSCCLWRELTIAHVYMPYIRWFKFCGMRTQCTPSSPTNYVLPCIASVVSKTDMSTTWFKLPARNSLGVR